MSWKAEIKDKNKEIRAALRICGYDVDSLATETILNIVDLVRESKSATTLRDVVQTQSAVKSLFSEVDTKKPKQ